jgi:hypothetical protein
MMDKDTEASSGRKKVVSCFTIMWHKTPLQVPYVHSLYPQLRRTRIALIPKVRLAPFDEPMVNHCTGRNTGCVSALPLPLGNELQASANSVSVVGRAVKWANADLRAAR